MGFNTFKAELKMEKYTQQLKKLGRFDLTNTIQNTLNEAAFKTQSMARKKIKQKFVVRKKVTLKGMIVKKTKRSLNISSLKSEVGHFADYMANQELGGVTRPQRQDKAVLIPTLKARIGGSYAKGLRRPTQRRYITLNKKGSPYFIGKPGGKKFGIYQRMKKGKLKMIYDGSERMITIKKRPWLKPAVDIVAKKSVMTFMFNRNAKKMLDRAIR